MWSSSSTESVMANIAEGFGRGTQEEFITFLGYALGSLDETCSHLCAAYDREFLTKDQFAAFYRADQAGYYAAEGLKVTFQNEIDANLIPKVGDDMSRWSPFSNGSSFLNQGQDFGLAGTNAAGGQFALTPWWALLYFAGWAAALLVIALFSASKRDA